MPNILGFLFGVAQMILYMMYQGSTKSDLPTEKQLANKTDLNEVSIVAVELPDAKSDNVEGLTRPMN